MLDPVAESIAFLKQRIEQDQTALSQLEALPAACSNGHSDGSGPLVVLVRLVVRGGLAGQSTLRERR